MNPSKLVVRAKKLREAIESGEAETVDAVYTGEERKQIKKQWPLVHTALETIDEQLQDLLDKQEEVLTQVDLLEAVSDYIGILETHERQTAPVEIVDAVPLPGDD